MKGCCNTLVMIFSRFTNGIATALFLYPPFMSGATHSHTKNRPIKVNSFTDPFSL